ncbi:MAG TPA: hypothetical protein VIU82_09745, partial [Bosea sp. (in: a-proteobacteria)]
DLLFVELFDDVHGSLQLPLSRLAARAFGTLFSVECAGHTGDGRVCRAAVAADRRPRAGLADGT